MHSRFTNRLAFCIFCLAVLPAPAHAQWFPFLRSCQPTPCPAVQCPTPAQPSVTAPAPPVQPGTPAPAVPPQAEQPSTAAADAGILGERGPAVGGGTVALASSNMIGDQLGLPSLAFVSPGSPNFPSHPGQSQAAKLSLPSITSFKIGENENPAPLDRAYIDFNFFNDVNEATNHALGSDIHHIRVYRETFGLEKTFLDSTVSVGLRLPLDTITAESGVPGLAGESTDIGDLAIVLKALIWRDRETGNLLSGGILISTPTGPSSFAGYKGVTGFNDATLQPFLGYHWGTGDFFVHGFLSIDVPTDSNDVTMLYNDIGVGYYLLRDGSDERALTTVAPTFEVHVNTPLNHRGADNLFDPAGTADSVDLTLGTHFEFYHRATLTIAAVAPVTGPKPFDVEAVALLNIRLGGR